MYDYDDEVLECFLENQGQLFSEPVAETPEEAEEFLKVSIKVDDEFAKRIASAFFVKDGGESSKIVKEACDDAFTRLIAPSVESFSLSLNTMPDTSRISEASIA